MSVCAGKGRRPCRRARDRRCGCGACEARHRPRWGLRERACGVRAERRRSRRRDRRPAQPRTELQRPRVLLRPRRCATAINDIDIVPGPCKSPCMSLGCPRTRSPQARPQQDVDAASIARRAACLAAVVDVCPIAEKQLMSRCAHICAYIRAKREFSAPRYTK